MKLTLLPKSSLGKWAVWLIVSFFIFLTIFFLFVGLGERGGKTFFSNLKLTIPFFLAVISGTASFFTGTFAILRQKERSVFVFLATLIGLFVFLWMLGELFSH